jgi:hypothetical protein
MSSLPKRRAVDALERRLLEAARLERPDARARQRAFVALGGAMIGSAAASSAAASVAGASGATSTTSIAVPAATASSAAVGGAKVVLGGAAFIGVAKALAIGAISGVVVLGAAHKIQSREPARPAPAAALGADRPVLETHPIAPPAPAVAETAEPALPEAPVEVPAIAAPVDEPRAPTPRASKIAAPKSAPPEAQPAPPPAEPPAATNPKPPNTQSLAQEVALLDQAREALVKGDALRALSILDGYEAGKIGTTLSAEATLLRIEALVQRGEAARASALAQQFLRANPQSPVADRMRSIIQAAPR